MLDTPRTLPFPLTSPSPIPQCPSSVPPDVPVSAESPDPATIPSTDLVGVTVTLITCCYKQREFIRVGYYVNNEHNDPKINAEIQVCISLSLPAYLPTFVPWVLRFVASVALVALLYSSRRALCWSRFPLSNLSSSGVVEWVDVSWKVLRCGVREAQTPRH